MANDNDPFGYGAALLQQRLSQRQQPANALGQGIDNQQGPILQKQSQDAWQDYYKGQDFNRQLYSQHVQNTHQDELFDRQQAGRMAEQHLQGLQQQDRDTAEFTHRTVLNDLAQRGRMAEDELLERHRRGELNQEHDWKIQDIKEARHYEELKTKTDGVADGSMVFDNPEDSQAAQDIAKNRGLAQKAVRMGRLTDEQVKPVLDKLAKQEEDIYMRARPMNPQEKSASLQNKVKGYLGQNYDKEIYPGVTMGSLPWMLGKNGIPAIEPSVMKSIDNQQERMHPKGQEAIQERQAEHQDKMRESEFDHWDVRRQDHEKARSALLQKTEKELETETDTEDEPGMLWGTNKRSRTAVERHLEAQKRVDAVLPPDLYGNSPDEYRAKHGGSATGGSAASPPGKQAPPQAAPGGQGNPAVRGFEKATAAARAGNKEAQDELNKIGIPWQ